MARLSGQKLALDGDLLRYDNGRPAAVASGTEKLLALGGKLASARPISAAICSRRKRKLRPDTAVQIEYSRMGPNARPATAYRAKCCRRFGSIARKITRKLTTEWLPSASMAVIRLVSSARRHLCNDWLLVAKPCIPTKPAGLVGRCSQSSCTPVPPGLPQSNCVMSLLGYALNINQRSRRMRVVIFSLFTLYALPLCRRYHVVCRRRQPQRRFRWSGRRIAARLPNSQNNNQSVSLGGGKASTSPPTWQLRRIRPTSCGYRKARIRCSRSAAARCVSAMRRSAASISIPIRTAACGRFSPAASVPRKSGSGMPTPTTTVPSFSLAGGLDIPLRRTY